MGAGHTWAVVGGKDVYWNCHGGSVVVEADDEQQEGVDAGA